MRSGLKVLHGVDYTKIIQGWDGDSVYFDGYF